MRVNCKKYQIRQNSVQRIFLITSSKMAQYSEKLTNIRNLKQFIYWRAF